jgi:uncharacterized damage-inducible protein DinB
MEWSMTVDWIRSLYDYSRWANGRVLDAAAHLSATALLAGRGPGADSVRDTIAHTMLAQRLWLARWQGDSPGEVGDRSVYPDVASLRAAWAPMDEATDAFVATLDEDRLAATLHYRSTGGKPYANTLRELLIHQVNHATQHRSEVAYFLSQSGHSPGDLDYVRYLRK